MVDLYFLGTGNAFGHDGRHTSSYLILTEKKILLDAGFSTFALLRNIGFTVDDIDVILLSHLHPDHYMFIPQIALEDYHVIKRSRKLPIYGPEGTEKKIRDLTAIMYKPEITEHLSNLFLFYEFGPNQEFIVPGGKVETLPAIHSPEARMQIIKVDGKKIGYTGDSALLLDSFDKLLSCDLVITEASSYGHKIPNHTSFLELLSLNISTDKKIYLSHIGDSVIAHRDKIKPPFYLSHDGLKVVL